MNTDPARSRPGAWAAAVLGLLAYLPALTAAPGRMPTDSKLYLYLDPGRFLGDAASSFDPRQFAGWVPHQHIAYLWPAGPWFWLFDVLRLPDWVAHRLWIGTLMIAAGLGVRWAGRLLGLGHTAALTAAVVYQASPYVLPYVSRTSVMLLPWAGLGWIVAFTIRATRRRTWGDPAAIALIVFTVGAVNATALAMIVPAPVLWLVHATWQRSLTWRQAAVVALRVAALTVPVCLWWIVALTIQGRFGAEVLPYSESLGDVSLTSSGPEVWRSLGYWLFYVRDPYAATTTESLRYLTSTPAIVASYLVPIVCLCGLAFTRWAHRRFAALCVATGAVLAVGVHPIGDRSPLMRLLAGSDDGGLALALRSSTRALPVMNLGLALLAGSLVSASGTLRLGRLGWQGHRVAGVAIAGIAVINLPSLWTGAFVDPALERDQTPPAAWQAASAALDGSGSSGRVLQLPGVEFGAYRWGYTVDQPLPGLTEKPLLTRDLLPLGSPGAMDLLYALDDRYQTGTAEPSALAPVARWLGVDMVWVTNDLAYDRFRTARPEVVGAEVAASAGVGEVEHFGEIGVNRPAVAMIDERALGDRRALTPVHPVDLYPIESPGTVVRAGTRSVVVSGSGDGLVDLAAAGVLDGSEVVQYSASLTGAELVDALDRAQALLVTDSNRDRARHWRSSQDTAGYTESDQPGLDLLRDVASDQRLPVFAERAAAVDPSTQTVARQIGPVTATATSYGEPFAYLPERRPVMAIDGRLDTAWTVAEHGDPIGETLRLGFADGAPESVNLVQATQAHQRRITVVSINGVRTALGDDSTTPTGQEVAFPAGARTVDLTIEAVAGGELLGGGVAAGVGVAEIVTGLTPTVEVVRPPHDALAAVGADTSLTLEFSRLRSDPLNRWRSDPEPRLVRQVDLGDARTFQPGVDVRVDPRATDAELAALFGWPAWGSTRLTGSIASAGVAAIDGDPATSWVTAFGAARDAVLTIQDVAMPVTTVSVTQPVGGYSNIDALTLRSGGQERSIELVPDAIGTATGRVDPPLPAGTVEVEIARLEPAYTTDRRYGDSVELPAAITEIALTGLPPAAGVADSSADLACAVLVDIDGEPLAFSVTLDGAAAIDALAAHGEPCQPEVTLDAGSHRIADSISVPGLHVDRIVLAQPWASGVGTGDAAGEAAGPRVTVVDDARFDRTIEVSGCPDGCWLVFGEGFNAGWEATGAGGSLGEQHLVDGGFNGWWLPGSPGPIEIHVHWTQQGKLTLALLLSAFGVLAAAALVAAETLRQRHGERATASAADPITCPAVLALDDTPIPARTAIVSAAAWTIVAGLVIGPGWAVWGACAGAVVLATRRPRLAELTSLATLVVVGGLVTVRERRFAPAPNGGWPGVFETWHGLAMFAVVAVVVAALTDRYAPGRCEHDRGVVQGFGDEQAQ